ncbi:unnamed protein product [Rangifer tarandus platyrhynchus]|uniref:Uncharacterized protein n=1 Tax=Rangifer tarandus platyrhynchus TaxID=3082113 RepID=A0ABN8YRR8_RANTA|nr:unnamed protein product [Rangifer tarandus platyrhynchus]
MTHRYVTCTNSKTNIISGFYYVYTAVAEGQKKCKISIPDPRSQKQNSKFAARGGDHPRRAALPGATGESASPTAPPPPRLRQAARPARPLHNSGSSPRPRTTFCVRELIPAAARLHRPCTHSPQGLSARAGNNSPVTQAVSRGQELELPARPGAATPGADERPPAVTCARRGRGLGRAPAGGWRRTRDLSEQEASRRPVAATAAPSRCRRSPSLSPRPHQPRTPPSSLTGDSLAVRARPLFEASARRPGSTSRLGSSPGDARGEAGDEWARAAAVPGSSGLGLISTGQ